MDRIDTRLQRVADAAAFAVPALALWLPSGYSYGAALLALAAVLGYRRYAVWPADPGARWLVLAVALMGALLALDMDTQRASSFEMPVKYAIAMACVGYTVKFGPDPRGWMLGVFFGAAASGLTAVVQVALMARGRAHGFTNEIQYGNLSLLLGVWSLSLALVYWRERGCLWRMLACLSAAFGLLGSLLSQSRGGWLTLVYLLPACFWLARDRSALYRSVVPMLAGLGLLLVLALPFRANLMDRIDQVGQETLAYEQTGEATTSVGQRLAHWRLAWEMGLDRPVFGWGGKAGYEREKQRRVDSGGHPPAILHFTHAHNEVLDMFAKRGLMGVAGLLFFYAVPLWLFWPSDRHTQAQVGDAGARATALAIRISGVLLVLAYIGFGVTQVFFSHNSGNMFYLFPVLLLYGMLLRTERGVVQPQTAASR